MKKKRPRDSTKPPKLPRRTLDADGYLIPLTDRQLAIKAKRVAALNREIDQMVDTDPPGTDEKLMQAIDSHRSRKLFEGRY